MNYQSPGVYVEEVSSGSKPIAGVGTSTAAFIGLSDDGPINKATLVTNWTQYVEKFGGFHNNYFMAYAVYSFFAEGGTTCYIVRVQTEGIDEVAAASVTIPDTDSNLLMTVEASSVGFGGNNLEIAIETATNGVEKAFNLTVRNSKTDTILMFYENLSVLNVESSVTDPVSIVIEVQDETTEESGVIVPAKRPENGIYALTGGSTSDDVDFKGDEAEKTGIHALDEVDDINIVAIPDQPGDREVISDALEYCRIRGDCFFIADPPMGETVTGMMNFIEGSEEYQGAAFNSSFGAIYYPWIYISDPATGQKKAIPPSGLVAGTFAHTDSARGVHKAPAGTAEGHLGSAIDIEAIITKGEHDILFRKKINVIRSFSSSGICIWGARTLSDDSEWNYINVRRLFLYVEESIDKASQWIAFEPNEPALWGKVKRNISAFLKRVWQDGALFGSTPEEAFFIKIDEENNPPGKRDLGQLVIEIGMAPVKPAEFVIIRISQKTL